MTYTKVAASCRDADPPGADDDDDADGRNGNHKPTNGSSAHQPESTGFGTEAALGRLDDDIAALLNEYEEAIDSERFVRSFNRVCMCDIQVRVRKRYK